MIFVGSGCTGAVHKLVHCLSLDSRDTGPGPVVFVGPFEHHSNLLPWRELPGALVLPIKEDVFGEVDINDLQQQLEQYSTSGRQIIGAFNAASNITGVMTDTDAISTLLHQYGGLVLWDFATAAPYVQMDMNPPHNHQAYKDAVYFSMHKFIGGPGTPGEYWQETVNVDTLCLNADYFTLIRTLFLGMHVPSIEHLHCKVALLINL